MPTQLKPLLDRHQIMGVWLNEPAFRHPERIDETIRNLAAAGCAVIRLFLRHSNYGYLSPEVVAAVRRAAELAHSLGMRAVLDCEPHVTAGQEMGRRYPEAMGAKLLATRVPVVAGRWQARVASPDQSTSTFDGAEAAFLFSGGATQAVDLTWQANRETHAYDNGNLHREMEYVEGRPMHIRAMWVLTGKLPQPLDGELMIYWRFACRTLSDFWAEGFRRYYEELLEAYRDVPLDGIGWDEPAVDELTGGRVGLISLADGNQIGASYPTADYFYLNVHKLLGDDTALTTWLGHVKWFWQTHTAPEAFTPEAENERDLGPDNPGGKQLQAVTCWYAGAHQALAGMDIDHEGVTLTPWGDRPVSVKGLKLRGACIDLVIRGKGRHIGSLKLNGKPLPAGSRKIAWATLAGKRAAIELTRSEKAPAHPVVVRADGLSVTALESAAGRLALRVEGRMSGEVVVQAPPEATVTVGGKPAACPYDRATGCVVISYTGGEPIHIAVKHKTDN